MELPSTHPFAFCNACMRNTEPCILGRYLCDNYETPVGLSNVAERPIIHLPQEHDIVSFEDQL